MTMFEISRGQMPHSFCAILHPSARVVSDKKIAFTLLDLLGRMCSCKIIDRHNSHRDWSAVMEHQGHVVASVRLQIRESDTRTLVLILLSYHNPDFFPTDDILLLKLRELDLPREALM